jgi:ParB/RepB/Spo0J family partition protein
MADELTDQQDAGQVPLPAAGESAPGFFDNESEPSGEGSEEAVDALDLPPAPPMPLDVRNIPLDQIGERENIRPEYYGIEDLAKTMHLEGQLQPCCVREVPEGEETSHGKPFELIYGHRRKRAAEFLGWETLRCEVRPVESRQIITQMMIENFQREDMSPVAEANVMRALMRENGWSQADVARHLGCDPSHVSHRLSLLKLARPEPPAPPPPPPPPQPTVDPETGETVEPTEEQVREYERAVEEHRQQLAAAGVDPDQDPQEAQEEAGGGVDILGMVDQGKLSASAAEVIAGLDDRAEQEKVAVLAAKYQWPVKQVEKYVRKLKQHELDMGPEEMGPVEMVQPEDAVDLQRIRVRPDITDAEYARINLLALLRNGMDQEVLEYLAEQMGYSYEYLWSYIQTLTEEQVEELTRLLLRRYLGAAHRFFDWEPSLIDQFNLPEHASDEEQQASLEAAKLALPGATGSALPPVDGADDPDMEE